MARREEGACQRACNRRATTPAGMDWTLRWSRYFGAMTKALEDAAQRARRARYCAATRFNSSNPGKLERSGTTTISMRRLAALPSALSFGRAGLNSP